ncbi:MAG TPA: M20/M25/M40 family metallo-hydrolase [Vicinamibacterales bacterium]|jgi:acetylornithine deacetylase/succinyl-diaminopimelate desuccinylase-like protein|nr:M20/M25/M40 family metallo-hydrolase [Vicinamibacterales bacterium]
MKRTLLAWVVLAVAVLPIGAATEKIDYDAVNKIKALGLNPQTSQVMEISSWLEDVYGPRLTGSANVQKAGDWAVGTMKEWGLQNVALEPWTNRNNFERGWQTDKFYMAAVSPQAFPIPGTPTGWTPGTDGLVRGEVVLVAETAPEDLQKYAGTLKGKWILTQPAPDVAAYWNPLATRVTPEELQRMELLTPPPPEFGVTSPAAGGRGGRGGFGQTGFNRNEWFRSEGAAGLLSTAPRGHGIYTIGGNRETDPANAIPQVVIPAEQYGRMARMIAKKIPVTIEADIRNTYTRNPPMFNVVGEIRGTDKADEIVMLGAHFDSWHAATGATDNGAGSAAMMEAMRILKRTGVTLRRTVRIGLWTGEEQGLIGSREYVAAHFGSCNDPAPQRGQRGAAPTAPPAATPPAGPAAAPVPQRGGGRGGCQTGYTLKPEHAKFAGYFNIDNGTGAIRGVYLQTNDAVAPIFREWMEPFHSIGMTGLTIRNTGGTDHQSFDAVGLPGFQFIQDEVEYNAVTHHTNLDSYERLQPADMMKNATIAAAFAYLAANRDEKLPRKPLPVAGAGRGTGQ